MATIAEGGLFPPVIDAYLPAKPLTGQAGTQDDIVVPFDINYNDIADIKEVQMSLVRQSNYHSAYIKNPYQRGIYVTNDITQVSGNIYEATIPFNVLNTGEVSYNEYYKLQVRLSKVDYEEWYDPSIEGHTSLSNYLTDATNLSQFSEWSTVCLIRFIAQPLISLDCNGEPVTGSEITVNTGRLMITGHYNKQDHSYLPNLAGANDNEYLNSYRFDVCDENDTILYPGEDIIVDRQNPNEINYTFPYYFDGTYRIKLYYTTANLYEGGPVLISINAENQQTPWGQNDKVAESISSDAVIGKVNISFEPKERTPKEIPQGSRFIIRRASDKDGFTIWDIIYTKTLTSAITTCLSFNDFTIESGVLYKYELIYYDPIEDETYSMVEEPVLVIFDHAFLTGEGTQLCVKFNPNISTFKTNVGEGVVTTIGGQYPYIRRNGDMYYKSFSLSGTIAYEMDAQHQFATRSSIYGEWMNVYGSYFVNHYYNQRNDRITQRKFRELVSAYLYDDVPKLFRSTPEGNILVRLTDISLSPKNEIGRIVYDFSCTATEIGDPSVENYKMYKIQDFGDE